MADPITVGMLVAGALSLGSEAVKTAVGEIVKDAYRALKAKLPVGAAGDVAELEKTPNSDARKAVIAEVVSNLPAKDQEELHDLAQALTSRLKEAAPAIGLDIGRLDALAAELGKIGVTEGIGARIQEAHISGTFRTGDISVGSPPENSTGARAPAREARGSGVIAGFYFGGNASIGTLIQDSHVESSTSSEKDLIYALLVFLEDRRVIMHDLTIYHYPEHLRASAQEIRRRTNETLQSLRPDSPTTPIVKKIQEAARSFQAAIEGAIDGDDIPGYGMNPMLPMGLYEFVRALLQYRREIAAGMVASADLCGLSVDEGLWKAANPNPDSEQAALQWAKHRLVYVDREGNRG
jgi:hypothetical protein